MKMTVLYDLDLDPINVLENAFKVEYTQSTNELWNASFSLPADDPKNLECLPFRYVRIADGEESAGLYRILTEKFDRNNQAIKTYTCEHVLGTLLDDMMFQYSQTTNLSPADTINYILSHQSTERWVLGQVDFDDLVSFKWESDTLLSALFSIPSAYSDDYLFTFETMTLPWTINLIRPSSEPTAEIRYQKNMTSITREINPLDLITRLYPLGYGEGDNQLTIRSVNGNVPYIDADAETLSKYGVLCGTFIDKTIENPDTLLRKAQTSLEQNKNPKVSYAVSAAEIYQITDDPIDKFEVGATVRIYDEDLGIIESRIVKKTKQDVYGSPGDVALEISSKVKTIADTTASLNRQISIQKKYAQGAVNIDSNDYQDNCDSVHPATINFYIPEEAVNVNKCLLTYKTDKFRAYETAVEGGGGEERTSASGGGAIDLETTGNAQWQLSDLGDEYVTDYVSGHVHKIAKHYHKFDLPTHSHRFTLPDHEHSIKYGIYESSASPSSVVVKVDGNTVSTQTSTSGTDIDIVPFLEGYSEGKIARGWHTVTIKPDALARINAAVVKMIFVQSRGDYTDQ